MKLFKNLASNFKEDDFLGTCSCSYGESNPHSQEPCSWIEQNLADDF